MSARSGGPGCSSLGGGWLSELGPWVPDASGGLRRNEYAWTSAGANLLFLESPAGVGFSYSNRSADAVVGDGRTAADARAFLLGFMRRFPGLAASDLYIAGESYAGHYVPTLAAAILDGNTGAVAGGDGYLNLKGVLIGNAWTDAAIDNLGAAQHWYSHYHISSEAFNGMTAACNFSKVGPVRAAGRARSKLLLKGKAVTTSNSRTAPAAPAPAPAPDADACDAACDLAVAQMGDIDIYDLFGDVCPAATGGQVTALLRALAVSSSGSTAARLLERSRVVAASQVLALTAHPFTDGAADGSGFPFQDACVDDYVAAYLNRADVRAALRISRPGTWQMCTDSIQYSYDDLLSSMLPVHRRLLDSKKLRILIFSGDVDGIVPTSGTRAWVESLQLPVVKRWRPWSMTGGDHLGTQVGGYVTEYEGLLFATVRGAGHMVPTTQPARALHLFRSFLRDEPL